MTELMTQITMAKFIYNHPRTKKMSAVDIYNEWREEYKDTIHSSVFLFDMLNIIEKMKVMDRELLKGAIEYDENVILPREINKQQ